MSKIEKVTKTTDNRFLNMYDLDTVTKTGHKATLPCGVQGKGRLRAEAEYSY